MTDLLVKGVTHNKLTLHTFDEEDPDVNVDMHYLFKNLAYGQRMETFFYAPHLKGSPY